MGCFDTYCIICGNTWRSITEEDWKEWIDNIDAKKIVKQTKWLNKCTLLLPNNKVIHGCKEVGCNATFIDSKKKSYSGALWLNEFNYFDKSPIYNVVFVHTDCWKFIKKKYNIELKYNNIPIKINPDLYKYGIPIPELRCGVIEKYWGQDQEFERMYLDRNIYMTTSPLDSTNIKNLFRINKIVIQLKLKDDKIRKGPPISATFYNLKDIKLGNDNKFWIIKSNKWIQIIDPVITKTYIYNINNLSQQIANKINKIPLIGEFNRIPLFVKSFNTKGSKTTITLIGTESSISSIDKFIT
jgi:hypothetical protein